MHRRRQGRVSRCRRQLYHPRTAWRAAHRGKEQNRGRRAHGTCQERVGKDTRTSGAVPTQDKKKKPLRSGLGGDGGQKRSPLAPHRKKRKKSRPPPPCPEGETQASPSPPPRPPPHHRCPPDPRRTFTSGWAFPSPPHHPTPLPTAAARRRGGSGPDARSRQTPTDAKKKRRGSTQGGGVKGEETEWRGGRPHAPAAARRGAARHGRPSAPLAVPPGRGYRPPLSPGGGRRAEWHTPRGSVPSGPARDGCGGRRRRERRRAAARDCTRGGQEPRLAGAGERGGVRGGERAVAGSAHAGTAPAHGVATTVRETVHVGRFHVQSSRRPHRTMFEN